MIKFELLNNNQYKFDDKIIKAAELASMISSGAIENLLKLDPDYTKEIFFETKIDLSNIPKTSPISTIQSIYFGAPGTGKSFNITKQVKKYYPDYNEKQNTNKNIFRTTIHSEYSYYDFIGNILPVSENNVIDYKFVPGVFTKALFRAYQTENPVFLIMEEMSRGNIAAIFGDLFQLLDRDLEGHSDYSINHSIICDYIKKTIEDDDISLSSEIINTVNNNSIYLPANLHILGSVNTSDQNVFAMDTAFKRRFQMEYVSLNVVTDENGNPLNNGYIKIGSLTSTWCEFYPLLNKFIIEIMQHSEDKQLGQFFLRFKDESNYDFSNCTKEQIARIKMDIDNWNKSQVVDKLLLYLWQDIEKSNYKNKKLFSSDIKSFTRLIEKAQYTNENLFSDDFLSFFDL